MNLEDITVRKQIIKDIKSAENVARKKNSFIDSNIFNDNIEEYVFSEIMKQTSEQTAKAMPIVSSINLAKRIVNNESTIYNTDPTRTTDLEKKEDIQVIKDLYEDNQFNSKFQKTNKFYKYRGQSFLQVVPKDGSIHLRSLMAHHIDVIPDDNDPEKAFAYIISAFDKSLAATKTNSDGTNQAIADNDDYKASLERYVVWTAQFNFKMNGKGELIGEVLPNLIEELPFVDVSKEKDFEFFIQNGASLSEFTVQYNAAWSDFLYISRMQGFSLGIFTGNPELMPKDYFVGPNRFILLPTDPNNPANKIEFKFESPTPDLVGALQGISSLLANYLTSRGVSPKTISSDLNTKEGFSSGIERLLAMIDKFEASKEDFDLFRSVETKIYNKVKKYLVALSQSELLDKKYWLSQSALSSTMTINFHKPEMIQTETDKLANYEKKISLGISDNVLALMDLEGIDEAAATLKIQSILERKKKFALLNAPKEDVSNPPPGDNPDEAQA